MICHYYDNVEKKKYDVLNWYRTDPLLTRTGIGWRWRTCLRGTWWISWSWRGGGWRTRSFFVFAVWSISFSFPMLNIWKVFDNIFTVHNVVAARTDGHCSGRHASYWNAFLFFIFMQIPATILPNNRLASPPLWGWHTSGKSWIHLCVRSQNWYNTETFREGQMVSRLWTSSKLQTRGCVSKLGHYALSGGMKQTRQPHSLSPSHGVNGPEGRFTPSIRVNAATTLPWC